MLAALSISITGIHCRRGLLLAAVGLLSQQAAVGQTVPTTPLTLPQVLEVAQTTYPTLRARQAAVEAAAADVRTTRANYLPQITMQAQALNGTSNQVRGAALGGGAIPISGVRPDFSSQTTWTSQAGLAVEWPVLTFGRYQALVQRANTGVAQAQADYEKELFARQVQVADAYLLALVAQKSVALQAANLKRAQALRTVIRAGALSGIRAGIDSSVTNAETSRAQLQLLTSQQQALQQRVRLAGLLGVPTQAIQLDSMQFYTKLPNTAPAISSDTTRLPPILRAYQQRIRASEAQTNALRMNTRPTLSLVGATWGRGSGIGNRAGENGAFAIDPALSAGIPFKAYNYVLGASLSWNVTELWRTKYATAAQQQRVNQAQAEYAQQTLQLQMERQNAVLQLELARQTTKEAPLQLDAAKRAYVQAKARYDAGLDNLVVLTQAAVVLNRAETDQALAVNNLWRALLLRAATNGSLSVLLDQL
ncbi:TolC family protein [Hymenobacter sp. GOD-10R]|uniref:TolC family protein n=1 Tax=Hymenobacter sp. GOD-10R TaxID=3093922 RepID=UPI002D780C51|nr:TolC family protein [Hymenobacter sp. GOD-10R]WRQ30402.1 TolC family protein [Hymenobacter sp. GOD-10R]